MRARQKGSPRRGKGRKRSDEIDEASVYVMLIEAPLHFMSIQTPVSFMSDSYGFMWKLLLT